MTVVNELQSQREISLQATTSGPPARPTNQFFGVGPITDISADEVERRLYRFQFEKWLEKNYRKIDDQGQDLAAITRGEMDLSMHRGYPADKVVTDMMREIHRYFKFPIENKMAVGLGGGHNGFSVCILHMMNPNNAKQHIYVDTPMPESEDAGNGGFFRQSWGSQILELHQFAQKGDLGKVHFSSHEGHIPSCDSLEKLGINLFIGVGHETTGATTYCEEDVRQLLNWIDKDPQSRHAIIDGTSMLGAMPWPKELAQQMIVKCCMFMPFQKAIAGIAGYYVASFTPAAMALIEQNLQNPAWAIPRHLKIAVPSDACKPLSSNKTTAMGPFYDAKQDKMLGGIINTFSNIAFAETTYGLLAMQEKIGTVDELNKRSIINRQCVTDWVAKNPLFDLGVNDDSRRGAAVTLLKVNDPDISDSELHAKIIAKAKQLLNFEGITHPNGEYEPGLDVARYVNAFPGTPGDFRAWIGGIRPQSDIVAMLDNFEYAYHRAKIVVLEELLEQQGIHLDVQNIESEKQRKDNPDYAYKVLIADAVGLAFDKEGKQNISEIKTHIEAQNSVFHEGKIPDNNNLETGKIHFFYQPDLSREDELLSQTNDGQYDAVIAAATFLPATSQFKEGGVRIGAGTGNMACQCWGGGSGSGGTAPLMNTPSFNSRATAHMAFKAILKVAPDLPVDVLHTRVIQGDFDTGKNLKDFPTHKLEGKRIAILGFGNIGREMCKIAEAFSMQVVVYARAHHKQWIESEGYHFADSPESAAAGADFLSPHLGLGKLDTETGIFANAGTVNFTVLDALNDGAVVVNYDRGELIDIDALDKALSTGKVRYISVDTDVFIDGENGNITGPMLPYYTLEKKHRGKMELLPHAAADTEHVSRTEGAKQAIDQIIRAIRFKEVVNLQGELPEGYHNAGAHTVIGVGKVTAARITQIANQDDIADKIRDNAEQLAVFWGAISSVKDANRRKELIERYGKKLILESNRFSSLMKEYGLQGPYSN